MIQNLKAMQQKKTKDDKGQIRTKEQQLKDKANNNKHNKNRIPAKQL